VREERGIVSERGEREIVREIVSERERERKEERIREREKLGVGFREFEKNGNEREGGDSGGVCV
jgi:hypothetical protein